MDKLAWFATTPEGEQLGKLAVKLIQIEWAIVPVWLAPVEPFRWFISLISAGYSHAKWLTITYSLFSSVAGLIVFLKKKGVWWQRTTIAFLASLNVLLTLSGGFIAVKWLNSIMPFGIRWVVPENAPFILANFHTHTTQSNGFLTPEQAVLWHLRHGYRVVAITDSNTVKGGEIASRFVERKKLPVTVLVGEEFRGKSHLVLLNIKTDVSPKKFDVPEAIREAKKQGGIVIAAHPWSGRHSVDELFEWGVDGFEIVNGSVFGDEKLQTLCRKRKLAALGNLDFRSDYAPDTATVLPKWATTPEKVGKALKEGKCAAIYFPEQVSIGAHSLLKSWLDELEDLWRTGKTANFIGIVFWAIVGFRFRRGQKRRTENGVVTCSPGKFWALCALMFVTFAFSSSLGVWAMARDLKQGWFPPIPLVIVIWAIACFVNWVLWWRTVSVKLLSVECKAASRTY